ncbi:MAG: M50 family metallopeptidase [Cyclobacteriaceae bacterium]
MSKKRKLKKVTSILLLGLTGAVFGYFFGNYIFAVQGNIVLPAYYYFIMILLLILAFFISIAIHEAGHLLIGKVQKFDFYMFVVGPLLWKMENKRLIFKWNKDLNIFGGLTYCIPKNEINLRKKFLWYIAGGPIASLLFAGIMYWLMQTTSPDRITNLAELFVQDVFKLHAFISMMIFLGSVIPVRSGGFKSDGGRIITLMQNNVKAKIELFLITTHAYLGAGTRPADLQIAAIEQYLSENKNDHYTINCHYYLYLVHFDREEYALADQHLLIVAENIEVYPAAMHSNIWLEIIFLQVFTDQNLQKIEQLWNSVRKNALTSKTDFAKAEAATLLLKKDYLAAETKIEEARQHVDKSQEKGMQVALHDWLNRLSEKLNVSRELNQQEPETN